MYNNNIYRYLYYNYIILYNVIKIEIYLYSKVLYSLHAYFFNFE